MQVLLMYTNILDSLQEEPAHSLNVLYFPRQKRSTDSDTESAASKCKTVYFKVKPIPHLQYKFHSNRAQTKHLTSLHQSRTNRWHLLCGGEISEEMQVGKKVKAFPPCFSQIIQKGAKQAN